MGIVLGFVLLAIAVISVVTLMVQVRSLHKSGKALADVPGDANGVSPAGMMFIGSSISH